jgi:hypothetical protein
MKNKNKIVLFLRKAMAYLEGWKFSVEVTDVKTKDMVLHSLIWAVARCVGANARTWSYTWTMSSRGKKKYLSAVLCDSPWIVCEVTKKWNKGCRVSSHHHTAERWHSHSHKYYCCKYKPANELHALESLCNIVYGIMWMHSGLRVIRLLHTHTKLLSQIATYTGEAPKFDTLDLFCAKHELCITM